MIAHTRESQSLYLKTLVRINKDDDKIIVHKENVCNKDFRGFSLFEEKFEDNRIFKVSYGLTVWVSK